MSRRHRLLPILAAPLFALFLLGSPASADETPAPATPAGEPTAAATSPGDVAAPPASGSYIAVTLVDSSKKGPTGNGEPVPGVTLSVEDADGAEVGSAVTDSRGKVFIPIPGNGDFSVKLDTDTLPDGIKLSGKGAATKKVEVKLEGATFVQFQIGVKEAEKVAFGSRLTDALVAGVKLGLIVALSALGLSLIFGTTGLTNFAHGEIMTFGALATYVANVSLGLPMVLAGVIAIVSGALFGFLQDRLMWRPLRHRGTGLIAMMIVSIGFGLFLRNIYQYWFGGDTRTLRQYVAQPERDYGPISLAPKELGIIIVAVVVIAVVSIAIMRTRIGKAMRAVSDNPALAASSGMRVDGVISVVWVLGAALTALSGTLLAINSQVNFLMGFKLLLLIFAGVTLGGLGTVWGALIGSLVIGIMVEVGPLFGVPQSIKDVGALVVLIIVLLVRPQGILGRRERIG